MSYEIFITSQYSSFVTFADTSIALPATAQGPSTDAFIAGQTHHVTISAVDINYYDFYRRGSDVFTGSGVISHLDGGVGVFGSMARVGDGTVIVR